MWRTALSIELQPPPSGMLCMFLCTSYVACSHELDQDYENLLVLSGPISFFPISSCARHLSEGRGQRTQRFTEHLHPPVHCRHLDLEQRLHFPVHHESPLAKLQRALPAQNHAFRMLGRFWIILAFIPHLRGRHSGKGGHSKRENLQSLKSQVYQLYTAFDRDCLQTLHTAAVSTLHALLSFMLIHMMSVLQG